MAFIKIRTNAAAPDTLIEDIGVIIDGSGADRTFTNFETVLNLQRSEDLRELCTDDAYGAGASTLVLMDQADVDVPQADVEEYLGVATFDPLDADRVAYDSTTSGLAASNAQDAIDELASAPAATDELVGVTGADTTPGYLSQKVVAGTYVDATVLNPAGDEDLEIDVDLATLEAALDHDNIQNVGTNDHTQIDAHIADLANPHATDVGNLGAGTLAELNAAITDATLDDAGDPRTPTAHAASHAEGGSDELDVANLGSASAGGAGDVPVADGAGGVDWGAVATTDELVGVSANDTTPGRLLDKLAAGNAIDITELNDGGDEDAEIAVDESEIDHANLQNVGTNTHAQIDAHIADLANPHATDIGNLGSGTLAELNAAVTDATLDDSGDPRTPTAHAASHAEGGADELDLANLGSASAGGAGEVPIADGAGGVDWGAIVTGDELVGVTGADTTPGYLNQKIVAGTYLDATVLNPAADEDLELDVDVAALEPAIDHDNLANVGTNDHAAIDAHIADLANPHATDIGNLGSGTLAELNAAVTDATLDDSGDPRTPTAHAASHSDGGSDEINAGDLGSGAATPGQLLQADGAGGAAWATVVATDELVGVTGADTTPGYLGAKVVGGTYITTTVLNPAADEDLEIEVDFATLEAAIDHTNITNIGTNTHAQIDTHIADTANPHGTDLGNLGTGTLAELNALVTDADLVPEVRDLTAGAGLTGGGDLSADRTFDVGAGTAITVNANDVAVDVATLEPLLTHQNLGGAGTNDHAAIDAHIADTSIHFTEASIDHGSISGLGDDDHTQYLLLAGRAGGQSAFGGTAASQELELRGTTNANLGLIRAQSPIDFDDVTPANALSPYSVRDASSNTITAAFIGGTYADQRTITFSHGLFVYETLRGSPFITSATSPAFAAFTLFNALPILAGGSSTSFGPVQALILNAGPTIRAGSVAGTFTCPSAIGINFVPKLENVASGRTLVVTNTTAVNCAPMWNTVAGGTINFGTIRGLHAQTPGVATFGSSAGVETMTAYYAVDVDDIGTFGGTSPVAALRSAISAGTNQHFLLNNGGAQSDFGSGQIIQSADLAGRTLGASADFQDGWDAANFYFWQFNGTSNQLRWSNPSSQRFLLTGNATSVTELNLDCARFSLGAQTSAVGNQVGVFVAGTRSVAVAGEWSDFLLTQAGNITVNAAMSGVFGWTINAPSITLGTGSVTTGAALNVGGNVNQGTNRYGLRVISNPSGGTLNYCARFEGAAGVRVDGVFEHTGSTLGFYGSTPVAQSAAYTPSNVTTDRAYDANSTTLDEVADVLGTLISDLQAVGIIG